MNAKEEVLKAIKDETSFDAATIIHKEDDDVEFQIDIYKDYRDEISTENAKKICESEFPMDSFHDWINDGYQYTCDEQGESLEDSIIDKIEENNESALTEEEKDEIREIIRENTLFNLPEDDFLKEKIPVLLTMDTGDANYDFVLNARTPVYGGADEFNEAASLVWLAKQQGYSKEQLEAACDDRPEEKGFLQSVHDELANFLNDLPELVFLVQMTVQQAININECLRAIERGCRTKGKLPENPGSITVSKETVCGLFDSNVGGGSILEIELDKDVVIPFDKLHSAKVDCGRGYDSPLNVYGACVDGFYTDTVKSIDLAPIQ